MNTTNGYIITLLSLKTILTRTSLKLRRSLILWKFLLVCNGVCVKLVYFNFHITTLVLLNGFSPPPKAHVCAVCIHQPRGCSTSRCLKSCDCYNINWRDLKKCCKPCSHVNFKGNMTKKPVQKQTHVTTEKHATDI